MRVPRIISVFIFLLGCFFTSACSAEVLDRFLVTRRAQLHDLRNVVAEYESALTITPPSTQPFRPAVPEGSKAVPKLVTPRHGKFVSHGRFMRLGNENALYMQEVDEDTKGRIRKGGDPNPQIREEIVYYDRVAVRCVRYADGTQSVISLANHDLPLTSKIDMAFGIRLHGESFWLDVERYKGENVIEREDGLIETQINGANGVRHVHLFDPRQGMALIQYNLEHEGRILLEIRMSEFEQSKGIALPMKVVSQSYTYSPDGDRKTFRSEAIQVKTMALGRVDASEFERRTLLIAPGVPREPDDAVQQDQRKNLENPLDTGGELKHSSNGETKNSAGLSFRPTHDFGAVKPGDVKSHVFLIRNDGVTKVTVNRIIVDCGCTAVQLEDRIIPVGGTASVLVELDTKGLRGRVTKQVAVTFQDGLPTIIMSLQAIVTE